MSEEHDAQAGDGGAWGQAAVDPFAFDPFANDAFTQEIANISESDWELDADQLWGDDPSAPDPGDDPGAAFVG